jgi:leucyl-tRNA synthetase
LLNPFAPHITEEIWVKAGFKGMLNQADWPKFDEEKTVDNEYEMVIQINGKIKEKVVLKADLSKEEIEKTVMADSKIQAILDGKTVVKTIIVPNKLVNIVVK